MVSYNINDVTITCSDGISREEAQMYVNRAPKGIAYMRAEIDGGHVNLTYFEKKPVPFERIRRITGYLVGSMGRWNNAKTAEEKDRVNHSVPCAKK